MNVPTELRVLPQWVWLAREQRAGKQTKVPVDARSGALASSTDPSTWSRFDDALNAVERHRCQRHRLRLQRDRPLCRHRHRRLHQLRTMSSAQVAQQIVEELADSTRRDLAVGEGLHCITARSGAIGAAANRAVLDGQKVEVYSQGRFFLHERGRQRGNARHRDRRPPATARGAL